MFIRILELHSTLSFFNRQLFSGLPHPINRGLRL